jgi:hypothetical protein
MRLIAESVLNHTLSGIEEGGARSFVAQARAYKGHLTLAKEGVQA